MGALFWPCDCKTFVGKVFVLPSNSLVHKQEAGSLTWTFEGMGWATVPETSFPSGTSYQPVQITVLLMVKIDIMNR